MGCTQLNFWGLITICIFFSVEWSAAECAGGRADQVPNGVRHVYFIFHADAGADWLGTLPRLIVIYMSILEFEEGAVAGRGVYALSTVSTCCCLAWFSEVVYLVLYVFQDHVVLMVCDHVYIACCWLKVPEWIVLKKDLMGLLGALEMSWLESCMYVVCD